MTTIKSTLFVENALSDSSFSQHDNPAANADFKDRHRYRKKSESESTLKLRVLLLKPFKKENSSNLFTFHRLFVNILLQNRDKNSTTLYRVVFVCTKRAGTMVVMQFEKI